MDTLTTNLPEKSVTGDIQNRASVVTLFRRFDLDGTGVRTQRELDMVFAGDASERNCQVANTILAFDQPPTANEMTLLKVPHHGSTTTAEEGFYHTFRAPIYLICARESIHGNPKYEYLKAIAQGFEQDPATYQATGPPALMLFSDPWRDDPVRRKVESAPVDSSVTRLLKSRFRPRTVQDGAPIFNYRVFRLRKGAPNAVGGTVSRPFDRTAGRILLGRNAAGGLVVHVTVVDKANESNYATGTLNDWVEVKP